MSLLMCVRLQKSFCMALFVFISLNSFAGGVAERKNEARKHASLEDKMVHQLTLDDVMPGNKTVVIGPKNNGSEHKLEPILIRVTGYSAFESEADAKSEPKRLLAQRASKIDAYRALSERVYGLSIKGQSKVKDFVLKEDQLAIGFESYIRGARVVSINEKKGIGFETVLELMLPGNFDDCLNKVNQFRHGLNCLKPLPTSSLYLDQTGGIPTSKSANKSSTQYQGSSYFLK